jgi:4-azaleucine resistance transporter AzlC
LNRSEFWAGVRAELPLLVGVFPFGMIYGLLALEAGLEAGAAQGMSAIVFAGSAQFLTSQLVHEGAPALVMVLTIAIVNLRHLLYSASLAPHVRQLSVRWKLLLSYLLTDEAYAVTITHYEGEGQGRPAHWFFLGAGLALWTTWQVSTALGIFVGARMPADWPLDFAMPLTFIAIVVPGIRDRATLAAALTAGAAALLVAALPFKLGLVLATLVGIAAGTLLEVRK